MRRRPLVIALTLLFPVAAEAKSGLTYNDVCGFGVPMVDVLKATTGKGPDRAQIAVDIYTTKVGKPNKITRSGDDTVLLYKTVTKSGSPSKTIVTITPDPSLSELASVHISCDGSP